MMHAETRALLKRNVRAVEERIDAACARAGRKRSDVTLVAVTKYVGPEIAALLPEIGVLDLGESRPQELWRKAASLPNDVRWHLVGHLQRNKIEKTLPIAQLIHSVDSVRLLEALEKTAGRQGGNGVPAVLLEVNASGEAAKHGFTPEELLDLADELKRFEHLNIRGLMTMAALTGDPRPTFARLRKLCDQLCGLWCQPHGLPRLSMGMTHDFEVAIEEGATLVRIGSALFDGLSAENDS